MPTWRIPPPNSLRSRRAWRMASDDPARAEPIGAPSPLEKQIETVSKWRAHSCASIPEATTAFISRAPSKCMARLCSRAQRAISAMLVDRVDPSAAAIMGIFQADQPGSDIMHIVRGPNGIAHVGQRKHAAVPLERSRRHARQPGDPAGLPHINMRRGRAQQFVARLCIDSDADLVGHRARWNKHRRLFIKELGDPALEALDRRVIAEDVVTDLRLGHRPPHPGGWLRDRVGT